VTASSLRQAVADGGRDVPENLRALVEKIREHAYRVTDDDVAGLKTKYSEDELFELVVSAAMGAARHRLARGLRALEEA
jgi:hypothetical protein